MVLTWYKRVFKSRSNARWYLIAGVIAVILIADVVGWRWYSRRYNDRAQVALAQGIDLLDRARRDKVSHLWEEAGSAFRDGYQRYGRSSLAPYFLAFWADTVMHQGKHIEALDLMNKAVIVTPKSSKIYYPFVIKRALMKIDVGVLSGQEALAKEGKNDLAGLAKDKKNSQRDEAIYYLGLAAFDAGDLKAAEAIWKELAEFGEKSLWAKVAQAKLEYRI